VGIMTANLKNSMKKGVGKADNLVQYEIPAYAGMT